MVSVYEAFGQAVSTGNWAALDAVLAADAIDHNPIPGQGPSLEGVKQVFAVFGAGFPDPHFTVEDMIAEGDKVVYVLWHTHEFRLSLAEKTDQEDLLSLIKTAP
ncbi:MAG: nuclear transport factor 2 family protein [Roseiflexaceae bacterium]